MRYPEEYKSNDTRIVKFEANHFQFLEYRFVGLFPLSLNSTRVSYNNSQVLKATASFSYDRYLCGETNSLARALGIDLNNRRNSGLRSGPGDNRVYNDGNSLNEIASGLSLLNSNSRYTLINGQTRTGSVETRFGDGAGF